MLWGLSHFSLFFLIKSFLRCCLSLSLNQRQSSVLECNSCVELRVKMNQLEHQAGKIICTLGRSTMCRWSRPFPVWWLAVSPGVAMLACIYADLLIGNFSLLADASRAAEPVIIIYCFLLRVCKCMCGLFRGVNCCMCVITGGC